MPKSYSATCFVEKIDTEHPPQWAREQITDVTKSAIGPFGWVFVSQKLAILRGRIRSEWYFNRPLIHFVQQITRDEDCLWSQSVSYGRLKSCRNRAVPRGLSQKLTRNTLPNERESKLQMLLNQRLTHWGGYSCPRNYQYCLKGHDLSGILIVR